MTEIGREQRQITLDIGAAAIPVEHGADGKGVAQVVDAGPAVRPARDDANGASQSTKDPVNEMAEQTRAVKRDEEARRRRMMAEPVAHAGIGAQSSERGRMKGQLA